VNKYKEALKSMVWQFGYRTVRGNKSAITTGGLSALEEAFEVLGWADPKYIKDTDGCICDVKGCADWVVAQGGMWAETGYWMLCSDHSNAYRKGKPQPAMKARAITREASRDEYGCLPMPERKDPC
jgi:hypothetical protein